MEYPNALLIQSNNLEISSIQKDWTYPGLGYEEKVTTPVKNTSTLSPDEMLQTAYSLVNDALQEKRKAIAVLLSDMRDLRRRQEGLEIALGFRHDSDFETNQDAERFMEGMKPGVWYARRDFFQNVVRSDLRWKNVREALLSSNRIERQGNRASARYRKLP